MATISGVAKLSNGTPAVRVMAVNLPRNLILVGAPGADGAYAIPGAGNGEWMVTAEGPAGYRPQSHSVVVTDAPEAETIFAKVWDVIDFDNPDTSGTAAWSRSRVRGATSPANAAQANLEPGISGRALRYGTTGTLNWDVGYSVAPGRFRGISQWFNLNGDTGNNRILFSVHRSSSTDLNMLLGARVSAASGLEIRFYSGNSLVSINVPGIIIGLNQWHFLHLQITLAGVLEVYFDDRRFVYPGPYDPDVSGTGSMIIRRGSANQALMHDEVYQYTAPLTYEEALYLFNHGAGRSWDQIVAEKDDL